MGVGRFGCLCQPVRTFFPFCKLLSLPPRWPGESTIATERQGFLKYLASVRQAIRVCCLSTNTGPRSAACAMSGALHAQPTHVRAISLRAQPGKPFAYTFRTSTCLPVVPAGRDVHTASTPCSFPSYRSTMPTNIARRTHDTGGSLPPAYHLL